MDRIPPCCEDTAAELEAQLESCQENRAAGLRTIRELRDEVADLQAKLQAAETERNAALFTMRALEALRDN